MIKIFEEFEKIKKKSRLKKGDYVICHTYFKTSNINAYEINYFLDNNVGQYVKYNNAADFRYAIKYDNVPNDLISVFKDEGFFWVEKYEIVDWSKNKEELEIKLMVKKYNI